VKGYLCFLATVITLSALYFPLKDYTSESPAERKEKNMQACYHHYSEKIADGIKVQAACQNVYERGIRYGELY